MQTLIIHKNVSSLPMSIGPNRLASMKCHICRPDFAVLDFGHRVGKSELSKNRIKKRYQEISICATLVRTIGFMLETELVKDQGHCSIPK